MNRIGCIVLLLSFLGVACPTTASTPAARADQQPQDFPTPRQFVEVILRLLETPITEPIDITTQPAAGNRLAACHVAGTVTLWVSRPLRVLDDMQEEQAVLEAGLLQFGERSILEGCLPDGARLDLSEQFANFVVAEEGPFHREQAVALASQLAQDFFHLADADGTVVPLVAGVTVRALGSVAHEYTIVLIRDAKSASYDAVVLRETVRTKFSPRLPETDRHLSRVKWTSRDKHPL
jgi:hypothetical protein